MQVDSNHYDLDFYLRHVTPTRADPSYSILKAHLVFEELLREYLIAALPHPKVLEGARLSFAQLLVIAQAVAVTVSPDSWHWVAIAKLNKLRNLLAHNLAPAALDEKSQDYIDFIIKKSGNPLPVTDSSTASCDGTSARPRYLAVDMVTAGLYMYTSTLLLRLAPVELKVQQLSSALEALRPAKGDAG